MNMNIARLLTLVAVAAPGQVWAADVGRVLLSAGDTVAVRDTQVIKLAFGSAVQDKDLLRTGSASNLQVRFTDESILSMRENSELRIDEFHFTGKEDGTERAFFSLLKGGLRKITGIVGRINHKNYQMNSITATIGIRGTHYLAALCQQDCRNPDGTPAKDGLYGLPIAATSTSRNSVTNETGEHIFGIGQPYYVQDFKTPPQLLLEAPGLLSVAAKGKTVKPREGTGTEQAGGSSGAQADSRAGTPPQPAPHLEFVSTENLGAGGTPAVLSSTAPGAGSGGTIPGVGGTIPGVGNGAIAHRFVSGVTYTVSSIAPNATLSTNGQGQLTAFNATTLSGLLGTGTAVADGSNLAAGNLHWGRWIGSGATITIATGTPLPISELHYIVGDVATLPGAGSFIYSSVGGTAPRTAAGLTGSFDSRGTVTVDFVQRNLTLNTWQIAFTGAAYTPQGAPTVNFTSSAIPLTNFQWTCAGSSCGLTSGIPGQFSGSFVGAGATGIGIVYRAQDSVVGNGDITGAQGFKKP